MQDVVRDALDLGECGVVARAVKRESEATLERALFLRLGRLGGPSRMTWALGQIVARELTH
jgi:hypothetical protein